MATSQLSIDIVDSSALFAELNSFLAEFRDCSSEVRNALVGRIEAFGESGIFELNRLPAAGAYDVFFKLELTQGFREFMAAARAGNFHAV